MLYSTSEPQFERLFKKFKAFRESKKFCDVTVLVPSLFGSDKMVEYAGHKIVLASQSSYFKSEFTTLLNAGLPADKCEIKGVSDEGFAPLLSYMYSNTLVYDSGRIAVLYQAADYLDINLARRNYTEFIERYDFALSQAIILLELANSTCSKTLENKFCDKILRNFGCYIDQHRTELLDVSYELIERLLMSESNSATEPEILHFMLSYVEKHENLDAEKTKKLYGAIKYPVLAEADFQRVKALHPKLAETPAFKEFEAAYSNFLKNPNSLQTLSPYLRTHREGSYYYLSFLCKTAPDMIFIFNTETRQFGRLSAIQADDESLQALHSKLEKIEAESHHFLSLELEGGLLSAITSYPLNEARLPNFFRYENQCWFNQYRTQIALDAFVHTDHRVINVGGYDPNRSTCLKGAAIYGDGTWHLIPSMEEKRCEHALVFMDGTMFAIGGQDQEAVLMSGECISIYPLGEGWKSIARMRNARQGHKAAALNGKIYVVGGYATRRTDSPSNELVRVNEVYDVLANTWAEVPSVGTGLHCMALQACNGLLYALMSPNDGWKKQDLSVHTFDPKTHKWAEVANTRLDEAVKIYYSSKFSKSDINEI